ncbi:hypothetical protein [Companilactobacillus tucceti]|nr:hypothetical protein [Companilactobacillus tucceti]
MLHGYVIKNLEMQNGAVTYVMAPFVLSGKSYVWLHVYDRMFNF